MTIRDAIKESRVEIKILSVWAWRIACRYRLALGALLLLALGAAFFIWPYDRPLSDWITSARPPEWKRVAKLFRRWGDFRDTATIFLTLYAAGAFFRRPSWRRAALACLIAACLAGATANLLRVGTGRPRPHTRLPTQLTGPTFAYKFQSFPSGHATTSTACAVSLTIALPWIGIPALLSATGVVWSSLYTRNHYVSDVLVGCSLGILFALPYGLAARRRVPLIVETQEKKHG